MFCRNCRNQINDSMNNCPNCGASIEKNTNQQLNAHQTTQQPTNYQPSNEQPSNGLASSTTVPLNEMPVNNTSQNQNKNNSKIGIIIVVGVILLGIAAVIGIGVFAYKQFKLNIVDKQLQEEAKDINDGLDELEDKTVDNETTEENSSYKVGDKITLVDGSSWYFMESNGQMITLLSTTNYKEKSYFSGDGLNQYETSLVKGIIDNQFLPEITTSLTNSNGNVENISARIISIDDIRKITQITTENPADIKLGNEYSWLFNTGSHWTMTHSKNSTNTSVYIITSWITTGSVDLDVSGYGMGSGNQFYVRPVLTTSIDNVKKN